MIMSIVRVILTSGAGAGMPDLAWLNLWSSIEASTAVIVCNLPAFKFLLRKRNENQNKGQRRIPEAQKEPKDGKPSMLGKFKSFSRPLTLGSHVGKGLQLPESGIWRGVQTKMSATPLKSLPTWKSSSTESIIKGEVSQSRQSDHSRGSGTIVVGEWEVADENGSTVNHSRGGSVV
jgi:hypothetical protein